jgi:hypothetical protein
MAPSKSKVTLHPAIINAIGKTIHNFFILKYIDNLKQYLYKNIKKHFNIKKSPELNLGIFLFLTKSRPYGELPRRIAG